MAPLVFRVCLALPAALLASHILTAIAHAYAQSVARGASVSTSTLLRAVAIGLGIGCGEIGVRPQEIGVRPLKQRGARVVLGALILLVAGWPFLYEPSVATGLRWFACCILLLLALIDFHCGYLPDALTLPLLWLGLLAAWAGFGVALSDAVLGTVLGYGLLRGVSLLFQACRGEPGMGGGDMKLLAALGAWLGWQALPGVLLTACLSGVLFVVLRHRGNVLRLSFAFGPHLAWAGAAALAGFPVVQYFFI